MTGRAAQHWFRCSCGASAKASSEPDETAAGVIAFLRERHLGDGHHEVDTAEHKRIRAKQLRDERKAMATW